jgi:Flp pilus assembly protein TadD
MRAASCLIAATLVLLPAAGALAVVEETTPASVPMDPDYEAGKKAVETKNWKLAVQHFNRAAGKDPRNADIQNYLGFANRQAGNIDQAFKHYYEALKLNPGHRGAHEYIGEAYLKTGNLPKAEEHLKALDRLCTFSCEEYRDLKKSIEEYRKNRKK